jgi:hypothetical protein
MIRQPEHDTNCNVVHASAERDNAGVRPADRLGVTLRAVHVERNSWQRLAADHGVRRRGRPRRNEVQRAVRCREDQRGRTHEVSSTKPPADATGRSSRVPIGPGQVGWSSSPATLEDMRGFMCCDLQARPTIKTNTPVLGDRLRTKKANRRIEHRWCLEILDSKGACYSEVVRKSGQLFTLVTGDEAKSLPLTFYLDA